MNIEIKIPGYSSGAQPTVSVTQPTSLQHIPIEYNVNVSDSPPGTETAAPPITSQAYRQTTYVTPPSPIINTSHTRNVVTSTSMRTRERDIQVTPLPQDPTIYHGYYTTPVTVTSSKAPNPQQYITGPQQVNPQMSLVQYDNRSFQATMDLSQYSPQEIQVRVKDRTVTVTANHREANHQGGFTQRSYSRQYTLPDDVNPNMVKCFISDRGELSVEAPRVAPLTTQDRIVPIEMRTPYPPPHPPPQHIQPLKSISRTTVPPPPVPPTPPSTPVEQAPKRPPRPANYGAPVIINKQSTPPQRTPTVSFRGTNDIDSGKQEPPLPPPPPPELLNERQTPFVEDVTSDVETQKIDFKSAKKMFEK